VGASIRSKPAQFNKFGNCLNTGGGLVVWGGVSKREGVGGGKGGVGEGGGGGVCLHVCVVANLLWTLGVVWDICGG